MLLPTRFGGVRYVRSKSLSTTATASAESFSYQERMRPGFLALEQVAAKTAGRNSALQLPLAPFPRLARRGLGLPNSQSAQI